MLCALKSAGEGASFLRTDSFPCRYYRTPETITLQTIEDELKKEFVFEDHRRTDMIRFGTFFTGTWWEKNKITPAYKGIFPIPALEMQKNNKLQQNPGY